MKAMTYSRSRLALLAALLIAALVVVGFLYTNSQKHQSAAPAPSASAAPTASGDDEDSTEGQDTADGTAPTVAAIPAGPMPGTAAAVKTVHSPDQVAIDINLAPGQCKARAIDAAAGLYLPDPACTPGAVDPAVTQDNLASTICQSGYTTTVRAPASDTDKTKALSLSQYGQTRASTTEYDHLISLQLGRHQRSFQPLARTQPRRSTRHHQPQGRHRDPPEQGRLRPQGHPRRRPEGHRRQLGHRRKGPGPVSTSKPTVAGQFLALAPKPHIVR